MSGFTYCCLDCGVKKDTARMSPPKSCPSCKGKRMSLVFGNILSDSDTGGIYSGYNMGLDAVVENRGHYKRLAKEKGLREAG